MSRRDYIAMAAHIHALNSALTELPKRAAVQSQEAVLDFAKAVARDYARDNYRFDRSKFLTACGYAVDMGGTVTR